MRLLLVEDNIRLAELVRTQLLANGFAVDTFGEAGDATAAIEVTRYDAVILDLGLPDMDGSEVLRRMRARGDGTPVLILTARDGLSDRVDGLDAGADDYLVKPFAIPELLARIRALLRRPGRALSRKLTAGNLIFDTSEREVSVDGTPVSLGRREMALLELLLRRARRVVSKTDIEESLYGFGQEIEANAVEVLVHRLRKRLADAGAALHVETLRGIGYLLSDHRG